MLAPIVLPRPGAHSPRPTAASAATLALAVAALLATVGAAAAEPCTRLADPCGLAAPGALSAGFPGDRDTRWYGWQVMLSDVAGTSLLVVGSGDRPSPDLYIGAGVGLLVLGGPLIHLANSRGDAAFASVGLRLLLPLAGGGLGVLLGPRDRPGCILCLARFFNLAAGVVIGGTAAMVVDWFWLSREPIEPVTLAAPEPRWLVRIGGSF